MIRDQNDGTIRFAHHTIRQYLLSEDAKKRNETFACSMDEAEQFVGQMCLTYLSFSDFDTQVAIRTPEPKVKQAPEVLSLGTTSWISNLLGVPSSLFEMPYRLLGGNASAPSPSIDYMKYLRPVPTTTNTAVLEKLSEKYQLLPYILEYWMFHTKDIKTSMGHLSQKLHEIARHKQLSFEFRPWGPNQHHGRYGCVSCTPSGAAVSIAKKLPFMSMLHYAAEVGHWPLMEPLITDYCSHEHGDDETLVIACRAGHLSIVKQLTQSYEFDLSNAKAINAAAALGNEKIFIHLLEATRTRYPFPVKQSGNRALLIASANGHEAIVEILCQRDVPVNTIFKHTGISPLSAAASNGHDHIVRKLIAKDAQILTKSGMTTLHCAAENGHENVVRALFEATPPIHVLCPHFLDALDQNGETSLHKASRNGHHAVVELLLKYSPKARNWTIAGLGKEKNKQKAMYVAASNGHVRVLALLAKHVSFDMQDSKGRTPLMIAAKEGHVSVIDFLMHGDSNGAFLGFHTRDEDGLNAYELAVVGGHENAVKAILDFYPYLTSVQLIDLLVLAAGKGHEAVIATLLDYSNSHSDFITSEDLLSEARSAAISQNRPEAAQLLGAILERFRRDKERRIEAD